MNQPLLHIENLSRRFGDKLALDKVSLALSPGTVLGLVGENGAGKTTLIKHILGLFKAQQGRVRVFGLDPVADPVGVLSPIGYLSEDRDLSDWMRIDELLRYQQAFYPKWDEQLAADLVAQFELEPRQKIRTLSRGQRARVGLLIALAHRPELLILDEPSSGLDPVVRRDILSAIIRTVADEGRTVLFSSHLLDEVQRVADQVAMLHAGRLLLFEPLERVLAQHRRIVVRFNEPQAARPALPGALSAIGYGREWSFLCNGGLVELKVAIERLGGVVVEEAQPSLDEVFVGRVSGE
jgi:ABC-2 type transport system ATP-binding protein